MERPERPSRHSKSHDKWKRIIQPAGDSDSSSDWSTDSENMRPDVRYFGGTEHVAPDAVASANGNNNSNRNTFECTSVNLQASTSSANSFQLDLRSMFPVESGGGKRKRPDVTADPSPVAPGASGNNNNSHLLHHDYAVGDSYKTSGVETYGWPWYVRPSSVRKRVRFSIPPDDVVHDASGGGGSGGDDIEASLSVLTTRQITVASLSETLPAAAAVDHSPLGRRAVPPPVPPATGGEEPGAAGAPGVVQYPLPLVKHRHSRSYELGNQHTRFDWSRKYSDVLHELEASSSSAPPPVAARTEDGGEVQVIAMAGPSTSAASTTAASQRGTGVRPDAGEEVIIVEDQLPAETPVLSASEPPAPTSEDRPDSSHHLADEEPLNQALIGLLECPVCMEYMRPPIHQCRRGHLVCAQCKPKLQACPTCRSRLSENRNLSMEKVADKLQYPCKNSPEGCCDTLRLRDKERHEANCDFRSYRCCFPGCDWKGFRENTLLHYSVKHPDKLLYGSEQTLRIQLGDMSTSTNQNWIVSTLEELFRVNFITVKSQPRATLFDTGTRLQIFGCVQYIGACKKADNFKYKLESKKFDGRMWRSAIYKRATHNDVKKCIAYYSSGDSFCIRGDTAELLSERHGNDTSLVVRVKVQPAAEVTAIA